MKSLEGLSLLITGGGSGIGLGTARYCVERGARVTICGRRADKLKPPRGNWDPPAKASLPISLWRRIDKNSSTQR